MAWVLTRGLATVRAEFNAVFPGRDKASDGSVGDLAHQTGLSGHNPDRTGRAEYKDGDALDEVRAIDVDRDLVRGSATDWMELSVQYIVRKAREGQYVPFRYIIYKERIWSRSDDWRTRMYTGANKHREHAHFSGDYTQTADNWTGSLGLASLTRRDNVDVRDIWSANAGSANNPVRVIDRINQIYAAVLNVDDAVLAGLAPRFADMLAAIVADSGNSISLTSGQVVELADLLVERLPTAEQIADATVAEIAS